MVLATATAELFVPAAAGGLGMSSGSRGTTTITTVTTRLVRPVVFA